MNISDLLQWLTIALTLIISILVPYFTQKENNKFQINFEKMKEINIEKQEYAKRKLFAYEEFYKSVGACVLHAEKENVQEAGASILRLQAYVPWEIREELNELYDEIKAHDWERATGIMQSITDYMANNINSD